MLIALKRFSFLLIVLVMFAGCTRGDGSSATSNDGSSDVSSGVSDDSATPSTSISEAVRPTLPLLNPDNPFEAYEHYLDHLNNAQAPPFTDPDYEPLRELVTEEKWEALENFLVSQNEKDFVIVDPVEVSSELAFIDIEGSTFQNVEGSLYVMKVCEKDASVMVDLEGKVVDDNVLFLGIDVEMMYRQGRWVVSGELQYLEGDDSYEESDKRSIECRRKFQSGSGSN